MNHQSNTDSSRQNALHAWEKFIEGQVYPEPGTKAKEDYRNYDKPARDTVREFYKQNHHSQTFAFVNEKRDTYLKLSRSRMSIFEALDYLNTLVDDSDPDIELDQLQHLLQTSEAIRADGHPDWFILTGLVHDLGKVLCLYGEPQWAVVGDTFPVGCRFDERIVYHEFFDQNPDAGDSEYNLRLGIYEANCGLRNVKMSWGHDEYFYHVVKNYLPEPALYMIRYHSFYAWHREHAYDYLCDDHDREMLQHVQVFNQYDLYSKSPKPPNWNELRPYYSELINKFFPAELSF
jgi:inositol oxygenase